MDALDRARSCREAVRETLNRPDAYHQYKSLISKMNKTCITKLNNIEKQEATKRHLRQKRAMLIPVSDKPRNITEEFKAWKSGGSENRWRVGTLKKTDLAGNGFGLPASVNKTVIEKPEKVSKTPERYSFAPKHIREMIKKNRSKLEERFN